MRFVLVPTTIIVSSGEDRWTRRQPHNWDSTACIRRRILVQTTTGVCSTIMALDWECYWHMYLCFHFARLKQVQVLILAAQRASPSSLCCKFLMCCCFLSNLTPTIMHRTSLWKPRLKSQPWYCIMMIVWLLLPMCFGSMQAFNVVVPMLHSVGSTMAYSTPYGLCASVVGFLLLCLITVLQVAFATPIGRLCLSCTLLLAVTHLVFSWT